MNERIKQLSIKAGFPEWSNHAIEFELEQFAELIVEECAEVIEKNLYKGIGWNTSRKVKRHFGIGVEE